MGRLGKIGLLHQLRSKFVSNLCQHSLLCEHNQRFLLSITMAEAHDRDWKRVYDIGGFHTSPVGRTIN